jgi:hypothetical protein
MAALRITLWYRIGAAILGLVGLGSGGVAVFLTHVEAGPVALITAGFLLLLIGMSGQLPSRLKIGDNEAEWNSLIRIVRETAETTAEVTASNTVRSELDTAMRRIERSAPKWAKSLPGTAFFIHAKTALNEAVSRVQGVQFQWYKIGGLTYEVLLGVNGKQAYCDFAPDPGDYDMTRSREVLSTLAGFGVDRLLVIADGELPRAARTAIAIDPLVETVPFSRDDDEGDVLRLMESMTSLLELPRP